MNDTTEQNRTNLMNWAKLTVLVAAMAAVGVCSDDDNDDMSMDGDELMSGTFVRANNGPDNAGSVDTIDKEGMLQSSFVTGANEGVAFDKSGTLYQAGDSDTSLLRMSCNFTDRQNGESFTTQRDRELSGANTGLMNPKGIAVADQAGLVLVANFGASDVRVFGSSVGGDVSPLATLTLAVPAWDLAYVEADDRLFLALTDGTIAVYDGFVANGMTGLSADRVITPSDADGTPLSVNAHGIAYDADGDRLVVSDVGDAQVADDGQIFVIDDASSASGNVSVARVIAGPDTMLGNPVDIVLSGAELRIAEKSNDAILIYKDIFSGDSGNIMPDATSSTSKPESLAEVMSPMMVSDVSDTTDPQSVMGLAASSNPAEAGPTTGQISQYDAMLGMGASFDTGLGLESVTYLADGDAVATFDNESGGGLVFINRAAWSRDGDMISESRDRMILGASTGLSAPKGLDVDSMSGHVFVAEFAEAAPAVHVFSACASGDVAPVFSMTTSDNARPWDVDYDAASDSAYVSLTDGTVAVFENVSDAMMTGSMMNMETRRITPTMGGAPMPAPTNLHGIDFDPASGALLVTDVGDAASATDGKIYVIPSAASADGMSEVSVAIAGSATMLGNPVDITFDGSSAYVAEKSNSLILRYDNLLSSTGGDLPATASMDLPSAESVSLVPHYQTDETAE